MARIDSTSAVRSLLGHRQDRRNLFRAAGILAAGSAIAPLGHAASARRQPGQVNTFPRHQSRTASPWVEISFRGVTREDLGNVSVVGASSGGHSGLLQPHGDGNGISFNPDARFEPGEVVTVRAGIPLSPDDDGSLRFNVARPADMTAAPTSRESDNPAEPPHAFRSRPDLLPPVIEIDQPAGDVADGYVFIGARMRGGQSGAMILDDTGEVVWYEPPSNELDELHDVKVQEYQGEPVVTFAEANGPTGYRLGHYVICNNRYERIAEFSIANGYTGGDHHEFFITPEGTALIGCYHPIEWDTSGMGGSASARVLDAVVQELEIETGRVLFEWHSLDDIAVDESYFGAPGDPDEQFDYIHQNSIGIDPEGNILVSARHTFAIYKINRQTGELMWRLNGKRSDFEMGEGAPFAWQHDARVHPDGRLSLFDNASSSDDDDATTDSRGLFLELDEGAMTATVAAEYIHPTGILATSQGNTQLLPNGNVFVGWGSAPVFSEFTADGELIFNGIIPGDGNSYRAYRFPWVGEPAEPPAVAVESATNGSATVYVSWNGATEVASWRVLGGAAAGSLEEIATSQKSGFETEIPVQASAAVIAVEALDADDNVLGASEPVEVGA